MASSPLTPVCLQRSARRVLEGLSPVAEFSAWHEDPAVTLTSALGTRFPPSTWPKQPRNATAQYHDLSYICLAQRPYGPNSSHLKTGSSLASGWAEAMA